MAVMQAEMHYDWPRHVIESVGNTCCFGTALKENKMSENRWGRNVNRSKTGTVVRICEEITHKDGKYDVLMLYSPRCTVLFL
jgi:hypothetical protein